MKKLFNLLCSTFILVVLLGFSQSKAYSEEKLVSVPLSFSYSSVYWWRGMELNDGSGVFWPGVVADIGPLSLSVAAGVSENWIKMEDSASKNTAKSYTETDYGISYSMDIEMISFGAGIMFVHYPFYDEVDSKATDPSFIETSLSIGIKTFLSPKIDLYYDYFIEAYDNAEGEEVPTAEDYYIKFSLSKDIISTENGFTFSLSASVGYYNNAYFEMKGFSDAVVTAGILKDYNNVSFSADMNYGRTLGKDFKDANNGIINHFWSGFGVSTTL